jgi:hypothetical protein
MHICLALILNSEASACKMAFLLCLRSPLLTNYKLDKNFNPSMLFKKLHEHILRHVYFRVTALVVILFEENSLQFLARTILGNFLICMSLLFHSYFCTSHLQRNIKGPLWHFVFPDSIGCCSIYPHRC